ELVVREAVAVLGEAVLAAHLRERDLAGHEPIERPGEGEVGDGAARLDAAAGEIGRRGVGLLAGALAPARPARGEHENEEDGNPHRPRIRESGVAVMRRGTDRPSRSYPFTGPH